MPVKSLALACVLSVVAGGVVQAATVNVLSGPVSVNKGGGFKSIKSSTSAGSGDLVMAGAGGSAEIIYDEGCKQTINSGESLSVADASICKAGGFGDPMTGLVVTGLVSAVVIGTVAAVTDNDSSPASP